MNLAVHQHGNEFYYVNPYTGESRWVDELFMDMGQYINVSDITLTTPSGELVPLKPHCVYIDRSPPDLSGIVQQEYDDTTLTVGKRTVGSGGGGSPGRSPGPSPKPKSDPAPKPKAEEKPQITGGGSSGGSGGVVVSGGLSSIFDSLFTNYYITVNTSERNINEFPTPQRFHRGDRQGCASQILHRQLPGP